MNPNSTNGPSLRVSSVGHALFAAIMIWLGATGAASGAFVQIWQPVPQWVPARVVLAYLCAGISLASGIGLLWQRTAAVASRLILTSLLVWLVVLRVPPLFHRAPLVLVAWAFGATAVMVAAAWVLYVRFAGDLDRPRLGALAGDRGIRIAQSLYGLSLIPFGLAHWMYVEATTSIIPAWIPWHVPMAYLTGGTFIAAGLAVTTSVMARAAAALSTLQIGLFGLIVWLPRVVSGNLTEFQRGEVVATWALMAGGWVVAESYRMRSTP